MRAYTRVELYENHLEAREFSLAWFTKKKEQATKVIIYRSFRTFSTLVYFSRAV